MTTEELRNARRWLTRQEQLYATAYRPEHADDLAALRTLCQALAHAACTLPRGEKADERRVLSWQLDAYPVARTERGTDGLLLRIHTKGGRVGLVPVWVRTDDAQSLERALLGLASGYLDEEQEGDDDD